MFQGPSRYAAGFLRRRVSGVVDARGQGLVPAVGTVVSVRRLSVEARAVSVPVHTLLATDPSVVQVAIRRVMFHHIRLLDQDVFAEVVRFSRGEDLVVKVLDGFRSGGVHVRSRYCLFAY